MSHERLITIGALMVPQVHSINGLATVAEAMALMKQRQVGSLAVNRRDENDELGLLVVRDIAREVIARNRSPERVNVYEIMSKPVLTLPPDMQARYGVRLLTRFGVSRALVVDQDRNPIGMVTLRDIVIGHVPG